MFIDQGLGLINPHASVSDFVKEDGTWNTSTWYGVLPSWVIRSLATVRAPQGIDQDRFVWRQATDGNFSICAAYNWLSNRQQHPEGGSLWRQVWKLKVPEKVKTFMWQVFHERLPTNSLRAKRGVSESEECPFECHSEETTIHILRDCEIARHVWPTFVDTNARFSFFGSNLQVWLRMTMTRNVGLPRYKNWQWHQVFCIVCWFLWKNRCSGIMAGTRL